MGRSITNTFYWHDYETWGVNPALDKPAQFAGVRTDFDLNIIGEPLDIMCRPALDTLPHIDAALVTGITPQQAASKGLAERDFFYAIHSELARPHTCGAGYNSLRFDDEVTRYGFYRNFFDPYAREWQSGNSRWDIIDMVRLCYAVRPDGIEWPVDDRGKVSFRLEKLTEANGISHEGAHDALVDVYATIEMARLIKTRQPKLYQHILDLRSKSAVQQALEMGSFKPKLHVSSKFGASFACASVIVPIAVNPKNKNEIICVDLRYSPEPLIELSVEEIIELQFTAVADLPEGVDRMPLKSVHLNRCPIVLSPGLIDDNVSEKMQIDLAEVERHRQQLAAYQELPRKLVDVYLGHTYSGGVEDVDAQLYEGFIPPADRSIAKEIPGLNAEQLNERQFFFEDERLNELYFRYRARNAPESLSDIEQKEWQEYCSIKMLGEGGEGLLALELARIEKLKTERVDAIETIDAVESYLLELRERLQRVPA